MISICTRGSLLSLAVLSLTLAACSGFLTPEPVTLTPPSLFATETPTILWFPATNTPTTFPGSLLLPTLEARPGLGEVLLTDTFDQPEFWATASSEDARAVIEQNRVLLAANPGFAILTLRSEPLLADFYAEVTVRLSLCRDKDQYGMVFRAQSRADYYRYAVNCNGQARLQRVRNGEAVPLQDWTFSSDAPPGAPGEVKLGVWVVGTEMRLFLNDRHQFTSRDPVLGYGTLGLFILSGGATEESASFSELVVYQASYTAPASSPTPVFTPTP